MLDEAALVASIRAGSTNAFSVVVERYQAPIARYLRRLVGNRAVAEDLTQETFLSAYTAMLKTNSTLSLAPWLYRIATNHAYMYFRRQKLRRFLPFLEDRAATALPEADLAERDQVHRALAAVPPKYAACLILHMVEGFRHDEVGRILGISGEAARKRVARGSQMFRRAYEEQEVSQR